MEEGICKKCHRKFINDWDDDAHGSGMCYNCFEDSLEEFEERRRERIAERNEY